MFKWLNKQGVEKDAEFSLQRADRFHYEYSENGSSISIVVESDSKKEDIFVSDAVASMPAADVSRITTNVVDALNFMKIKFQIR